MTIPAIKREIASLKREISAARKRGDYHLADCITRTDLMVAEDALALRVRAEHDAREAYATAFRRTIDEGWYP